MAKQANEQELDTNLDALDLDSVNIDDLGEDLDDMDLEGFGEINETIDFPHIKVASKEVKEFLTVAKLVSVASGKDFVTKSVAFKVDGDKVKAYATDMDVYIEKTFELLNQDNILDKPVVVPVDVLIKLMKAVPVNTIIFEEEGQLKIRLYAGDMPLDTYNVAIEKFIYSDEVKECGTIQSKDLNTVLRDFAGVMNQAVMPAEKRILCTEDRAYVSYMWSAISCAKTFSAMDFKSKDVNIIRSLTAQKEEALTVYDVVESVKVKRKVIEGTNYRYAFMVSAVKVPEATKQMLNKIESDNGVYIDLVQIYKMVELAADLPSSLGKVAFNYDDDQNIVMTIEMKNTKNKNCKFVLSGNSVGNNKKLPSDIVIQAKMLRLILRAFAQNNSVRIVVTPEGLGIYSDDYTASVMVNQGK